MIPVGNNGIDILYRQEKDYSSFYALLCDGLLIGEIDLFDLALTRIVLSDEPFPTVKVSSIQLRPAAPQPLTSAALMHSIASPVPSLPILPGDR
jgi:hypothetical protein